MAEALATIGLVSAIIQFIDFGSKLVRRLQEFHSSVNEVPKAFQDIEVELPLLIDTLKRTQKQAESGIYTKDTQEALLPVIERCRFQAELIDSILIKLLPKPEDSSLRRGMMAFSSLGQEKKVEQITSTIQKYVQILTYHQSTIGTVVATPPTDPVSYEVRPLRLIGSPIISDFVKRPQIAEMIEKAILPISIERQKIALLHGIGGTGKSQMAKHYAELHRSEYSAIFWINATTEHLTELSIAKLAELIPLPNVLNSLKKISTDRDGIEEARQAVNEWLCSKGNDKWLLIFDDVPEMTEDEDCYRSSHEGDSSLGETFDAYKYVPKVSHGSVLVTSRVSSIAYAFGAEPVHVDAMSENESVQLLCKASRRGRGEETEMRALATRLGMHPLALTQAGRYLLETHSSVLSYLEKYDTRFKMLLKRQMLTREYHHGSVDAVLSLSFDSLATREPSAAALLMMWSCFDKSNIFFGLFGCLQQLEASDHSMSITRDLLNPQAPIDALPPTWLDQICTDEDVWMSSVSALQDFSFIRHNDRVDSISLHPLIHEWSIRSCESTWANGNMAATANVLGAALVATHGNRLRTVHSSLTSHIDHWYSLLSSRPSQSAMEVGADTAAVFEIAHFYRRRNFLDRYNVLSNDLLHTFTTRLGPTHRTTVELQLDMFSVLLEESKWEEAIQALSSFQEQILQIQWMHTLTLKENNAFVLSSLAWHLSIACSETGQTDPLKQLLLATSTLQDDPDVSRVRPCLIFAHLWLDRQINLILEAVQENQAQVTALDNPSVLMEAETKYLEMLDDASLWPINRGRQQLLTQSHLLRLLGEQYFALRDFENAKACLVRSLELFKEIDGRHGRTTLGLAGILVSHGWTLHSPPTALRNTNWHEAIVGVLRQIEQEIRRQPQSTAAQQQQRRSTALSHLHWSKAVGSVREIVREQ